MLCVYQMFILFKKLSVMYVFIQFQGAKSDQLVRLDVCQLPCIMFVCLSSFQIIAGTSVLPPFKLYVGE